MKGKHIALAFIVIALLLALTVAIQSAHLGVLVILMRFFETMIPVLAVGALTKYLLCCDK